MLVDKQHDTREPAMQTQTVFSIKTHNGVITMKSLTTGEHRTFRVRTQAKDASFMPGARLLEMLIGPNNEWDYRSIGFVQETGKIFLWQAHFGDKFYSWVAAALETPEKFMDRAEFMFEGRCRVCNRPLTNPESIETGIGPTCASRVEV